MENEKQMDINLNQLSKTGKSKTNKHFGDCDADVGP